MANSLPNDAIQAFIQCHNVMNGDKKSAAEIKDRKSRAKEVIIQYMLSNHLQYIGAFGIYITLRKKKKRPPINRDFIIKTYKDYEGQKAQLFRNVNNPTLDQIAEKYGDFVVYVQKQMTTNEHDIKMCKKKPMSAMIFDSFNDMKT